MRKGYVTEIFSSFQGEGPYAGRRQIFIRFAGCPLSCFYCDTSYARDPKPEFCTLLFHETRTRRNPVSTKAVLDYVKELRTPDVHSIAYTGGEPLFSAAFVKELAMEAKEDMRLPNYIETNGYSAKAFAYTADYFDFASIDIKLRDHHAVEEKEYDNLYRNAVACIRIAVDRGIETIVKVVVIRDTPVEELKKICEDLSDFDITFVLQPVTAPGVVPDIKELFVLSETAGLFLRHVMVMPQVHNVMRIP